MPDTSASLYEQLFPLTTVAKTRFVENFSGDALDTDRWNTRDINPTNNYAMSDEVDGGFKITTGSINGDQGQIDFNDKTPFAHTGCVQLAVTQRITSTYTSLQVGFKALGATVDGKNSAYLLNDTGFGTGKFYTGNASTASAGSSISACYGTSKQLSKIELDGTNAILSIDGVLASSRSDYVPATAVQPFFNVYNRTGSANEGIISYMECYNT